MILTTPLARVIVDACPGAELWWLVRPEARSILTPSFGVERVLTLDKRGADRGFGGMRAAAARLAALDFSVAIGVQRSLRTALLLALAGVPLRIGFGRTLGAPLYHRLVAREGRHACDRLLRLATALDVPLPDPPPLPAIEVDQCAAESAERLLGEYGVAPEEGLIVLAPGSAWPTKEWPVARFAELAAELAARRGERIVVVGTAADRRHAPAIAERLDQAREGSAAASTSGERLGGLVDLTGRTDAAVLVAVLARASLVVANDSAPAHIAAALGRPVVALFGPTVPAQGFAPLGPWVRIAERELSCRPCSRHGGPVCPIDTHACLTGLAASVVLDRICELDRSVGERGPAPPSAGPGTGVVESASSCAPVRRHEGD